MFTILWVSGELGLQGVAAHVSSRPQENASQMCEERVLPRL